MQFSTSLDALEIIPNDRLERWRFNMSRRGHLRVGEQIQRFNDMLSELKTRLHGYATNLVAGNIEKVLQRAEDDSHSDVHQHAIYEAMATLNMILPSAAGDAWAAKLEHDLAWRDSGYANAVKHAEFVLWRLESIKKGKYDVSLIQETLQALLFNTEEVPYEPVENFLDIVSNLMSTAVRGIRHVFGAQPKPARHQHTTIDRIMADWLHILEPLVRVIVDNRDQLIQLGSDVVSLLDRKCSRLRDWKAYLFLSLLCDHGALRHRQYDNSIWNFFVLVNQQPEQDPSSVTFSASEWKDKFLAEYGPRVQQWVKSLDVSILKDLRQRLVTPAIAGCRFSRMFINRAQRMWTPGTRLPTGEWVGQGSMVAKRYRDSQAIQVEMEATNKRTRPLLLNSP